ncbi:MAG TPA: Crp/Fnr family transcriptional regulator [Alphaproteobacteria bacterium]|nr:Crp/Fnr family transcriptional regulator [Alphaproteobacteria bacterium]
MFSRIGEEGLERLAKSAAPRRLAAGESLYSRGDAAIWLYVIAGGRVDLLQDDKSGNRTQIETLAAPQMVGALCALDGDSYAHTAEGGSSGAQLLAVPGALFAEILRAHPQAARLLLAETSARLRHLVGQLGDLKLRDSVQRLAGYLVELTPARNGAAELTLPAEKRAVADRLGMKPETLSRALARLEAMGLAHPADAATLRVPDLSNLRHLYLSGEKALLS